MTDSAPLSAAVDRAVRFAELHRGDSPLLLGNAWDPGSAKALAFLGFVALATTSAGHAATLGRHDGGVSRDEAIDHATAMAAATPLPVSADLENGFADHPEAVAETYRLAAGSGLAGASVEDYDPLKREIYEIGLARERVAAAAEAAHAGPVRLVLTGRCENFFRGVTDLGDTITRLQAYQEAGADVLFAPAVNSREDIARIVREVDRPVNVIALPGVPDVAELAKLGVARISVGSGFSLVAFAAMAEAARELLDHGTYGFWEAAAKARAIRGAFDAP